VCVWGGGTLKTDRQKEKGLQATTSAFILVLPEKSDGRGNSFASDLRERERVILT
jgi:hypothetical protein